MDDPEVDFSSDRDQWHIWMGHHWAGYDGSEFFHWTIARLLCDIAERTLRAHFFRSDDDVTPEGLDLLEELEELQQQLAQHDGFRRERREDYWYQVRAQLRRVQPLVERLLSLTPPA